MHPIRFDTLARSLHNRRSRRGVLATVMAGALGLFGLTETAARKKKGKGKKKKKGGGPSPSPLPAGCIPDCSGGRNCGSNGCGGSCGACSGTDTCGGSGTAGICGTSGACPQPCTGGQACQSNGQCSCPADRPLFIQGLCRQCNVNADCGNKQSNNGYFCRHDIGSVCSCAGPQDDPIDGLRHDCGDGFCRPCCTAEHCIVHQDWSTGVICTAPGNPEGGYGVCRCPQGQTACLGLPKYCADLLGDPNNCGECGRSCNGAACVGGRCAA